MEDDHGITRDASKRESLGFALAVERQFLFLSDYGFRRTLFGPTLVRYERNGRFIEIFHGSRSYAVGAQFGLLDDPDANFSLPEVAYAFGARSQEFGGHTKDAVDAAVRKLAAEVLSYPAMLDGRIPIERIHEYRQHLTDYYAGKKDEPNQQYKKAR